MDLVNSIMAGILLIGGHNASLRDYPEAVYINASDSSCSATIVGPEVLLTAAHCSNDGEVVKIAVGSGKGLGARCVHHPKYSGYDYDIALCFTGKPIRAKYAHISDEGPELGDEVTLSGFGCTKGRPSPSGGNDGTFRVGKAPVTELPTDSYHWFDTKGVSALCYGDSGGPSYKLISNPRREKHMVIGVNSRGDIVGTSMMTAVFHPEIREWLEKTAEDEERVVCGINSVCKG